MIIEVVGNLLDVKFLYVHSEGTYGSFFLIPKLKLVRKILELLMYFDVGKCFGAFYYGNKLDVNPCNFFANICGQSVKFSH